MQERFREWGAGLSDEDFACALAALGLVDPDARRSWRVKSLIWEILSHLTPSGELAWTFKPAGLRVRAGLLAKAWLQIQSFVVPRSLPIAIQSESLEGSGIDPTWVAAELSRPEVGAASVTIQGSKKRVTRDPASYAIDSEPVTEPTKTGYPAQEGYSISIKDYERSVDEVSAYEDGWRGLTESAVAKETARKAIERLRRDERREQAPPRWLQARIRSGARDVKTLRAGGSYEAVIRIGKADTQWVSVDQPFSPPEEPPAAPEGHWLTVIFWEPRVSPDPQVQSLLLPPEGDTQEIAFPFDIPAGLGRIAARVTVLHANRVLQTGLLRAIVGGRRPWTFTLDATPRTRLEGLSARSEFDVALVLNHDDDGTARATVAAGDQVVVLDLDDGPLDALTDFLRKQISKIARAPERYETLSSPGTLELLRTLAQKGGALHDDLCNHTGLSVLAEAKSIQVTSAKIGSFLPVELLYRYEPPDDTAGLCPNAAVALQAGECPGGCPADKRQHVCPLGFWGLSRIIERHTHTAENQARKKGGDFLLQPEPVRARTPLVLSNRSLLAASGRASEVKKEAVDELLQALGRRGMAARAASWPEWIEHVESDRPSLLVLLPHHVQDDGEEILEIGEGDRLKSSLIRPEHVRREDGPYPILLLLGCETNLARIAFDNFATRFRDKKAAVVVSTIATILGRHASPAAARLVELLDEEAQEEGSTFGEVMVRLRRKLLETGSPMALGLTAYGDADWILTRQG
jgi:hypothetical protein